MFRDLRCQKQESFSLVLTYTDILNIQTKPQYGHSDVYRVSAKIIEELKPKELENNKLLKEQSK